MDTYLRAIQSDVQNKRTITNLYIASYVLWPEVAAISIRSYNA